MKNHQSKFFKIRRIHLAPSVSYAWLSGLWVHWGEPTRERERARPIMELQPAAQEIFLSLSFSGLGLLKEEKGYAYRDERDGKGIRGA